MSICYFYTLKNKQHFSERHKNLTDKQGEIIYDGVYQKITFFIAMLHFYKIIKN